MRLRAGFERTHGAAHQPRRAGLDGERKALRRLDIRPGELHVEGRRARTRRRHRNDDRAFAAGLEPDGPPQRVRRHDHGPVDVEIDGVLARLTLDIVDSQEKPRLVADREEARQGSGQHHGIADDHVRRGAADPVLRPRDRHHPRRAVEGRDVEGDGGRAVLADLDHARVAGERLLRRRNALKALRGGVAAGADRAARALHAVDQVAVEIADLGRKLLLAEEVVGGIRGLIPRQVEDADIDGRDRDPRLLAGLQPRHLDRQGQRLARTHLRRGVQIDGERARRPVDLEPSHPERAARHALGGLVQRPVRQRHEVGPRAPLRLDRDRCRRALGGTSMTCRSWTLSLTTASVALPAKRGVEPRLERLAGAVARLVERHVEEVGRVRGLIAGPADRERHARLRRLDAGDARLQTVAAPLDGAAIRAGRARVDVERPVGDAARRLDRLVAPAPVAVEPLIAPFDLRRLQATPLRARRVPSGLAKTTSKVAVAPSPRSPPKFLRTPNHRPLRQDRQGHAARDRPPAGLADAQDDSRLESDGAPQCSWTGTCMVACPWASVMAFSSISAVEDSTVSSSRPTAKPSRPLIPALSAACTTTSPETRGSRPARRKGNAPRHRCQPAGQAAAPASSRSASPPGARARSPRPGSVASPTAAPFGSV